MMMAQPQQIQQLLQQQQQQLLQLQHMQQMQQLAVAAAVVTSASSTAPAGSDKAGDAPTNPVRSENKRPREPKKLAKTAKTLAAAFSQFDESSPAAKKARLEGDVAIPPVPVGSEGTLGPDTKDKPTGFLPEGTPCGRCKKDVAGDGGVYCGRRTTNGGVSGCSSAVCWRCMARAPRTEMGCIRTSKAEFVSLGAAAWWMHDFCMLPGDRQDYYRESGVGQPFIVPVAPIPGKADSETSGPGKTFEWE
jgi:hypothetical protein